MGNHGCINGELEGTDRYSAPVPLIGLYIAAASMVCCLLILLDIRSSFIKRQRWMPCKWFKLNSVTLSLIAVVVKLNVDLTTSMPRALDQLSKLSGTTSLCIYMCYIFPSIPDMKDSTNMFALSILVITVFVNMCIQLSTGVIALFIPEHVLMMCLMLMLLVMLWHLVLTLKTELINSVSEYKSRFVQGIGIPASFLWRLKDCYMGSYKSNPQFLASKRMDCGIVGDLSLVALTILVQAAIRSIVLKKENLCTGKENSSDYKWSVVTIAVTQAVLIIIGTLASFFRRCAMSRLMDDKLDQQKLIEEPYRSNPIWEGKFFLVIVADSVYFWITAFNWLLFYVPITLCSWLVLKMRCAFTNRNTDKKTFEGFLDHLCNSDDEWIERKSARDMKQLIERSTMKSSDLCELLSRILPLQPPASHTLVKNVHVVSDPSRHHIPAPLDVIVSHLELPPVEARLLTLVVLVRIVEVVIPPSPCQESILKAFREGFETLHFIEKHMHNTRFEDMKKTEIAKAVWTAGSFSSLLPVNLRSSDQVPTTVEHAFSVIQDINSKMVRGKRWVISHDTEEGFCDRDIFDEIGKEVGCIRSLVMQRLYSSVEEMSYFMECLFVDLLDAMLAQLPEAIFRAVTQSPDEEFEERVHQSLYHFCKLESWSGIHRWQPPKGCENCPGLLYPEEPATPSVQVKKKFKGMFSFKAMMRTYSG